jgi:hypothetical protein
MATRAGRQVSALAREADPDFVARAGPDLVTGLPGPYFGAVLDAYCSSQRWPRSATADRSSAWPPLHRSPPERGIAVRTL